MAGVLQIVFPGNVFERQYNAASTERLNIGKSYLEAQFIPSEIVQSGQIAKDERDLLKTLAISKLN